MDVFGSFSLLLAFVCACYAVVGGIFAIRTRHPLLVKSTRQAGIATCALIFLSMLSLEYLLFTDNFSMAYVVQHSNRDLSTFYKVAALWAGQEGSLLFCQPLQRAKKATMAGRLTVSFPKLFLRLRTKFQTSDSPMTLAKWFFDYLLVDHKGVAFYHRH